MKTEHDCRRDLSVFLLVTFGHDVPHFTSRGNARMGEKMGETIVVYV